MLDRLTRRDFEDLGDDGLALEVQGRCIPVRVTELRDLPPISPRAEPFAVTLAGPSSFVLPQGIHPVLHPRHGRLDLFVVPIARTHGETRYEVIFN